MAAITEMSCSNDEFAVFPLSRTWKSIREYIEQWNRVEAVQLLADRYDTFLLFHCDGHEFCAYDDGAMLRLSSDGACPPELLAEVRDYFGAFLPAKPWGHAAQFGMFGD